MEASIQAAPSSASSVDARRESLDRHSSSEAASSAADALRHQLLSRKEEEEAQSRAADDESTKSVRTSSVVSSFFTSFGAATRRAITRTGTSSSLGDASGDGSVGGTRATALRRGAQSKSALPISKDDRRLQLENLLEVRDAQLAVQVLSVALDKQLQQEDQCEAYCCAAMDLITHLCEQDPTRLMLVQISRCGAAPLVNQLLVNQLNTASLCEAGLRAACSMLTPPPSEGPQDPLSADLIEENRQVFGSTASLAPIVDALLRHRSDGILLEWGLRVLFYLSIGRG